MSLLAVGVRVKLLTLGLRHNQHLQLLPQVGDDHGPAGWIPSMAWGQPARRETGETSVSCCSFSHVGEVVSPVRTKSDGPLHDFSWHFFCISSFFSSHIPKFFLRFYLTPRCCGSNSNSQSVPSVLPQRSI